MKSFRDLIFANRHERYQMALGFLLHLHDPVLEISRPAKRRQMPYPTLIGVRTAPNPACQVCYAACSRAITAPPPRCPRPRDRPA